MAGYNVFVPTVDGEDGVIPEAPELLAIYRRKIPIMLGTTRDESALRLCKLKTFINLIYSNFK